MDRCGFKLYCGIDTPNDIGAAMHRLHRGDPSGERDPHRIVIRYEGIPHPDLGRDGICHLVDIRGVYNVRVRDECVLD